MFVKKQIQIVQKVILLTEQLEEQYASNKIAKQELTKLNVSLKQLVDYLNQGQEDASKILAGELQRRIEGIDLHIAILKEVLKKTDFNQLEKGIKLIKATVHFHPHKYTYWSFVKAWFYEWFYFI